PRWCWPARSTGEMPPGRVEKHPDFAGLHWQRYIMTKEHCKVTKAALLSDDLAMVSVTAAS
ncbi:MAG: hypothetical protein QM686_18950, partial [Herbaspirillum sp.]